MAWSYDNVTDDIGWYCYICSCDWQPVPSLPYSCAGTDCFYWFCYPVFCIWIYILSALYYYWCHPAFFICVHLLSALFIMACDTKEILWRQSIVCQQIMHHNVPLFKFSQCKHGLCTLYYVMLCCATECHDYFMLRYATS